MNHVATLRRFVAGRFAAVLVLTVLAVSGCSVLPETETLAFYRLSESMVPEQTGVKVSEPAITGQRVLRISTPYGNRAVGSTRILVMPEAERVSAYKGARWSDTAPVLLRDRLVEMFRASQAFRSVVTDSSNLSADLELSSDLSGFHAVYQAGAPVVTVILDATLTDPTSSGVLASKRFHVERPVQGKEVPEVVRSFGLAVDDLGEQLQAWTRVQLGQGGALR